MWRLFWGLFRMGLVFLFSMAIMVIGMAIGVVVGLVVSQMNGAVDRRVTYENAPNMRMPVGPLLPDLPATDTLQGN